MRLNPTDDGYDDWASFCPVTAELRLDKDILGYEVRVAEVEAQLGSEVSDALAAGAPDRLPVYPTVSLDEGVIVVRYGDPARQCRFVFHFDQQAVARFIATDWSTAEVELRMIDVGAGPVPTPDELRTMLEHQLAYEAKHDVERAARNAEMQHRGRFGL